MDFIIEQIILLLVIVFSLSCHECSHGLAAYGLGDPTAKNMGRLTLNPLKHIDPLGLLMLFLAKFGWAKPVPVNPRNFTKADLKTGMLLTAVAGPMANLFLVFIGTFVYAVIDAGFLARHYYFWLFLNYFIVLNANLAFFNLLPVPPLDGSKILFADFARPLLSYPVYPGALWPSAFAAFNFFWRHQQNFGTSLQRNNSGFFGFLPFYRHLSLGSRGKRVGGV